MDYTETRAFRMGQPVAMRRVAVPNAQRSNGLHDTQFRALCASLHKLETELVKAQSRGDAVRIRKLQDLIARNSLLAQEHAVYLTAAYEP